MYFRNVQTTNYYSHNNIIIVSSCTFHVLNIVLFRGRRNVFGRLKELLRIVYYYRYGTYYGLQYTTSMEIDGDNNCSADRSTPTRWCSGE